MSRAQREVLKGKLRRQWSRVDVKVVGATFVESVARGAAVAAERDVVGGVEDVVGSGTTCQGIHVSRRTEADSCSSTRAKGNKARFTACT